MALLFAQFNSINGVGLCRNDWLVLPQNQRIIGGLTFQPRTLF